MKKTVIFFPSLLFAALTAFGTGTNVTYFAQWDGFGWVIRREDNATILAGTTINVLVIKQ